MMRPTSAVQNQAGLVGEPRCYLQGPVHDRDSCSSLENLSLHGEWDGVAGTQVRQVPLSAISPPFAQPPVQTNDENVCCPKDDENDRAGLTPWNRNPPLWHLKANERKSRAISLGKRKFLTFRGSCWRSFRINKVRG